MPSHLRQFPALLQTLYTLHTHCLFPYPSQTQGRHFLSFLILSVFFLFSFLRALPYVKALCPKVSLLGDV